MPGPENRKEERYPAELLPETLQFVKILFDGSEMIASVIDASYSGFGFQIFVPAENIVLGTTLPIYPLNSTRAIYGVIVYARAVDAQNSRVGVQLKEVGQYLEYRKELEQIMALVAPPPSRPATS